MKTGYRTLRCIALLLVAAAAGERGSLAWAQVEGDAPPGIVDAEPSSEEPSPEEPLGGAGTGETEFADPRYVMIVEVEYDPPPPPPEGPHTADDLEYIWIENFAKLPVDLTGMSLASAEGMRCWFAPGTVLEPLGEAVVVTNPEAYASHYGSDGRLVVGEYSLPLRNDHGTIQLLDGAGNVLLEVEYPASVPGDPTGGGGRTDLAIVEVMYHPPALPEASPYTPDDLEFLTLLNTTESFYDLSECTVSSREGVLFRFPLGTGLESQSAAFIVSNPEAFASHYDPCINSVLGEYTGHLGDDGDTVTVRSACGELIVEAEIPDAYVEADGGGRFLQREDWCRPDEYWTLNVGAPGCRPTEPSVDKGLQLPGDFTQDAHLNISDGIALLDHLVDDGPENLPCEGDTVNDRGKRNVLDVNGDMRVDLADAAFVFNYLFASGPPPHRGTTCVYIERCKDNFFCVSS